jgi:hypothetical protein
MLFSSFSWTQFFIAVMTLTSLYYLCVLLSLYREEFIRFSKRLFRPAILKVNPKSGISPNDPMGKISSASEFSLSDSSTIDFADEDIQLSTDQSVDHRENDPGFQAAQKIALPPR